MMGILFSNRAGSWGKVNAMVCVAVAGPGDGPVVADLSKKEDVVGAWADPPQRKSAQYIEHKKCLAV